MIHRVHDVVLFWTGWPPSPSPHAQHWLVSCLVILPDNTSMYIRTSILPAHSYHILLVRALEVVEPGFEPNERAGLFRMPPPPQARSRPRPIPQSFWVLACSYNSDGRSAPRHNKITGSQAVFVAAATKEVGQVFSVELISLPFFFFFTPTADVHDTKQVGVTHWLI